jgi:hypothetical protein
MDSNEALAMIEALEYFTSRVANPAFTPEEFTEAIELIARQRGVEPEVIRVRLMAIVSMVDPHTVETVDDLNREIANRRRTLS